MVGPANFSPALVAVTGLMRAAFGHETTGWLDPNDAAPDPERIVETAASHMVLPLLGLGLSRQPQIRPAIAEDLALFLDEMLAANRRRHTAMRAQLGEIGRVLDEAGLSVAILKGGAEMLRPSYADPAARLISDLDLLAGKSAGTVQAALIAAGWREAEIGTLDRQGHHHLPPLSHADWPAPVEVHRELAPGARARLLPAEAILSTASPSTLAGIALPAGPHRLAHLVIHGPMGEQRFQRQPLALRDLADLHAFESWLTPDDWAAARGLLASPEARAAMALLAGATSALLTDRPIPAAPTPAPGAVEATLAAIARPGRRRFGQGLAWLGWYLKGFIGDPARRRHYLAQMLRPGGFARVLRYHRDRDRRMR